MNAAQQDRLVALVCWGAALVVAAIPLLMLWSLLVQGAGHISLSFLSEVPRNAGRDGGIASLLVSTGMVLGICLAVTVPLGTLCALYLYTHVSVKTAAGRLLDRALDILSAVPSIVFGLFGYVFFAQLLGFGFSILSGGLSLACMALPLYVRLTEQALRASPSSYRMAAEALNLSRAGFTWRVLLPSAAPGIAAALIISAGRALAETAVLIFTAGYVTRMPESVLDSGRVLSVHIYDLAMNVAGGSQAAAATALVLVVMLIGLNLLARLLTKRWAHMH